MTMEFTEPRSACPACASTNLHFQCHAIVSPWIWHLSRERKNRLTRYISCKECNSTFFDIVFSESLMNALYSDYRGEKYFNIRNSWEPSYTRELNQNLISSKSWLRSRQEQIMVALKSASIELDSIDSVIDFGGGHGGVMPPVKNKFLIEKNKSVATSPDIRVFGSISETKGLKFDLLMCCGVLEHVNSPVDLLFELSQINCQWYLFEVPSGIPKRRRYLSALRLILIIASSQKFFWRLIQASERKVSFHKRHLFPLRCSEHLQFFTSLGVLRLLNRSGFEVIGIFSSKTNEDLVNAEKLGFQDGIIVVARKSLNF
jgi:hypothetical protein